MRQGVLGLTSVGEGEEWFRGGRLKCFSLQNIVQVLCIYVEAANQPIIYTKLRKKLGIILGISESTSASNLHQGTNYKRSSQLDVACISCMDIPHPLGSYLPYMAGLGVAICS